MQISCIGVGKRFVKDWVFRELNFNFQSGGRYAIIGANGSGKSTLLQILLGSLSPTIGTIDYNIHGKKVEIDQVFNFISFAAPYLDLIDELTPLELLNFHASFRAFETGLTPSIILQRSGLIHASNKSIKNFSSGMRQRLKLAIAIYSKSEVLFLDEPTSNLDKAGQAWYIDEMGSMSPSRTVIIASNDQMEYNFCNESIAIESFKAARSQ